MQKIIFRFVNFVIFETMSSLYSETKSHIENTGRTSCHIQIIYKVESRQQTALLLLCGSPPTPAGIIDHKRPLSITYFSYIIYGLYVPCISQTMNVTIFFLIQL